MDDIWHEEVGQAPIWPVGHLSLSLLLSSIHKALSIFVQKLQNLGRSRFVQIANESIYHHIRRMCAHLELGLIVFDNRVRRDKAKEIEALVETAIAILVPDWVKVFPAESSDAPYDIVVYGFEKGYIEVKWTTTGDPRTQVQRGFSREHPEPFAVWLVEGNPMTPLDVLDCSWLYTQPNRRRKLVRDGRGYRSAQALVRSLLRKWGVM